jgi:hypothetical protein
MSNKLIYALGCLVLSLAGCGGGGSGQGTDSSNSTVGSMVHLVGHLFGSGNLDGLVSAAAFNGPREIAADSSGNIYVADTVNHLIRKITPQGVVSTLAGSSGVSGSANGTGAAAQFNSPYGLAVNSTGEVFVADRENHTIRKITPAGVVTTFAGQATVAGSTDGIGAAALFNNPSALAFDSLGNLFVAEFGNNVIRKILPNGTVSLYAGTVSGFGQAPNPGVRATAQFCNPQGLGIDSQNNIYVADTCNHVIQKISGLIDDVSIFAGSAGSVGNANGVGTVARFNNPYGIAVDSTNNLYVADAVGRTVRKITTGAAVTTLAGASNVEGATDGTGGNASFTTLWGLVVSNNTIFAADASNNNIRQITLGGTVTTWAGVASQTGSTDATGIASRFSFPYAVAYDTNGNAFIADRRNHTVRKVTMAGVVTTVAGTAGLAGSVDGTGGTGGTALFDNPTGIAVDAVGNIYVAESGNHTIRKITHDFTQVTTFAGAASVGGATDGPRANARFLNPEALALDSAGNLYVADTGNSTVRKITALTGAVSTLAGTAGTYGSQDGTGGAASFGTLFGVTVDASGNVFVTDNDFNIIRKISPAGVVTTLAGTAGTVGTTNATGAAARFNQLFGIAIDSAGNLYVTDAGNSLVRKISSAGVVTTVAGTAGSSGIQMGNLPGVLSGMAGLAIHGSKMLLLINNGAVLVSDF